MDSGIQPVAERTVSSAWYDAHEGIPTRCKIPARVLASIDFQKNPTFLEIEWVKEEHGGFFELLEGMEDAAQRSNAFHDYALHRFWAHEPLERQPSEKEKKRFGYISLLRGWGFDSNSGSGAVLKGWAEQRFGLRPIWHGHSLSSEESEKDRIYLETRTRGYIQGIGMQLDLLYTYCQNELKRRYPDQSSLDNI